MQSASSLKSHKKKKHDPKICPDCGVVVKGEKALRNHRRKHVTIPCQGQKNKDPKLIQFCLKWDDFMIKLVNLFSD